MTRWVTATALAAALGVGCSASPVAPDTATPTPPVVLAAIEGLVREVDGPPVAGATVFVTGISEAEVLVSDAAGRFVVAARDGMPGWPRQLRVTLGGWHERYIWGDSVFVSPTIAGEPVAVDLKLQPMRRLSEAAPVDARLTDDALAFTQGESFECRVCLAVDLTDELASAATAFEVRVHQDQPARLRLLMVGSLEYADVLFGESEGDEASTLVTLRIMRAMLSNSQFPPTLYVEKVSGPPAVGLRIELVPVFAENPVR